LYIRLPKRAVLPAAELCREALLLPDDSFLIDLIVATDFSLIPVSKYHEYPF